MNKKQFISEVAENTGYTISDTKVIVNEVLDNIQKALVDGVDVQFPGFGIFSTIKRAARIGRNPATGKSLDIAASTGVKFKAGATLKKAVK